MSGYQMAYNSEWHEKMRAGLQRTRARLEAYEQQPVRKPTPLAPYPHGNTHPDEREARIMEAIRNIGR